MWWVNSFTLKKSDKVFFMAKYKIFIKVLIDLKIFIGLFLS